MCVCGYLVFLEGPKCRNVDILAFLSTFRRLTPWGEHIESYPLGCSYFLKYFQPYFKDNLGLVEFFMFKLTKMPQNSRNMVKT